MGKYKFISYFLILIVIFGFSSLQITKAADNDQKVSIGIMEFNGHVEKSYQKSAADILAKVLFDFGRFNVISRSETKDILKEQKFQKSGLVEKNEAVKIGELLAVDVAAIGTINNIDVSWENTDYGGYYHADTRITVKFIEVKSGKIVRIIESNGSGTGSNKDSAVLESLDDCFKRNFLSKLKEEYSIQTNVIKVENNILYFLNGNNLGIKKGNRYKVVKEEEQNLDEFNLGDENKFMKEIGMIEVINTSKNIAKAKILWKNEKIKKGNIIREVVEKEKSLTTFNVSQMKYTVEDQSSEKKSGSTYIYEIQISSEKSFKNSSGFVGGFGKAVDEITLFDLGYYYKKEIPIISGNLYITLGGRAGMVYGIQSYSDYYDTYYSDNEKGSSSDLGFYGNGAGGFKYYINHGNGARINIEVFGQFGPLLNDWSFTDEYDTSYDVTDYVKYPEIDLSGMGFRTGLSFPFNIF